MESAREQASEDPFRNPVLAVTLAITRSFDRGEIAEDDLEGLFARLRAEALDARAQRLRDYVGMAGEGASAVAAALVAAVPDRSGALENFAAFIHRTAFAVVFTAHPTFGMPRAVAERLARAAGLEGPREREGLIGEAAALSMPPATAGRTGGPRSGPDPSPWRAGSAAIRTGAPILAGGIQCATA